MAISIQETLQIADNFFTVGDYKNAYNSYTDAAQKGSGEAAYKLGQMYEKGIFVKRDYKAAMQWYVIAAGKGNKEAKEKFLKGLPKEEEPKEEEISEQEPKKEIIEDNSKNEKSIDDEHIETNTLAETVEQEINTEPFVAPPITETPIQKPSIVATPIVAVATPVFDVSAPIITPPPYIPRPITETKKGRKGMFLQPFSFKGRISRLEFFLSYLIMYFVAFVVAIIYAMLININQDLATIIYLLSWIPLYWFLWAQGAKRCHDRGNSGWYQLIPFYVLWMFFGKGEPFANKYGEPVN